MFLYSDALGSKFLADSSHTHERSAMAFFKLQLFIGVLNDGMLCTSFMVRVIGASYRRTFGSTSSIFA